MTVCILNKTWSGELEILKKAYVTVVAMATMTFQNGGYFPFKVIELENEFRYPHFLFHEMIPFSFLNYFYIFKNFY